VSQQKDREGLERYCAEVLRFRKALNLTSVQDAGAFMSRFVVPSVALSRWIPEGGRLLDIGSGMGVPGIPLLIERRDLQGVLVERRKKRAEFLRHLIRVLKLDAEVYDADINDLPSLGVDVCVARAVTREAELLQMCSPHVNDAALAVLPVPQSARPVTVMGWTFSGEETIKAVEDQQIHCYRYHGEAIEREDVSRET